MLALVRRGVLGPAWPRRPFCAGASENDPADLSKSITTVTASLRLDAIGPLPLYILFLFGAMFVDTGHGWWLVQWQLGWGAPASKQKYL